MVFNNPRNNQRIGQKSNQESGGQIQKRRPRRKNVSEYKKLLQEKQSLKRLYGLSEKQCKRYVKETLMMKNVGNLTDELIKRLERRIDSVVFRLGFAKSLPQARQLVTHAYFLVNGKSINIPSFQVKKGDIISLKEGKKQKAIIKDVMETLKKMSIPSWLEMDKEKLQGKILQYPTLAEVNPPIEISLVFEYYSR